jgi:uncharacterized protein (TIGR00369 family)
MSKTLPLEDDAYCFACGRLNPQGLKLSFKTVSPGKVQTGFTALRVHQGYKDVVHGGIIATLLDEAMAHAAISSGSLAVTAAIEIRFKKPFRVGETALVEAAIEKENRGLFEASATLSVDGGLVASGRARLLRQS